jgi:hypothetical protein
MSRNVFEHTTPTDEEMQQMARELGGELYSLLPELSEGERYQLVDLPNGRTVLVTKRA